MKKLSELYKTLFVHHKSSKLGIQFSAHIRTAGVGGHVTESNGMGYPNGRTQN